MSPGYVSGVCLRGMSPGYVSGVWRPPFHAMSKPTLITVFALPGYALALFSSQAALTDDSFTSGCSGQRTTKWVPLNPPAIL